MTFKIQNSIFSDHSNNKNLLQYLESYLTERRNALFDKVLSNRTRHITVVAEDTYQEHNASALIRTCDCFGIQDFHILEKHNEFKIAKGMAKGAEKWVDVHMYEGAENKEQECIDRLRKNGYKIVATTPHNNDCLLDAFDLSQKSALFFGREKYGLSDCIIEQADSFLKIPMVGFTESFNISVSTAIILHTLTNKLREIPDIPWQLTEKERIAKKIEWCIKTIQNGKKIALDFLNEEVQVERKG